jgi:broad specificity phosphatase PhoE
VAAIYLIRHGQASFGEDNYDQLSERGMVQSRITGEALARAQISVGLAVCGSLQRHRQTADECLQAMGSTPQQSTDPGWDEFDYQGVIAAYRPDYADPAQLRNALAHSAHPKRDFQQLFNEAVSRWVSGAHDADYQESWQAFCTRCCAALDALQTHITKNNTDVVVFTSGGPISAIVRSLLGLPDKRAVLLSWGLVNCGMTKLIAGRRGNHLSTLNCHAHFEGSHADLITYR